MRQADYHPSTADRALKAAFMVAVRDLPPEEEYTQARIEQLCPHISLDGLWNKPGFQDWFTNLQEYQEMAEMASVVALMTAIEVMTDPDEKGQARVTAAKLAIEAADKMPKGKAMSGLPKAIDQMDEGQLKAFIAKNTASLKSVE